MAKTPPFFPAKSTRLIKYGAKNNPHENGGFLDFAKILSLQSWENPHPTHLSRRSPWEMSLHIVMGVAGCGKTSVARLLAEHTRGIFLDADDFHPAVNRTKMAAGIPLADTDRWSWLDALNLQLKTHQKTEKMVFLAYSALRRVHRDRLAIGLGTLRFIHLQGHRDLIAQRLAARSGHFMPPSLLDSQLAILETPTDAIIADIADPLPVIVEKILLQL